ncbi:MAG: OmpA family protein, partial [Devosia sp.]
AQAGSIVTLDAPRIDDYWLSATRQPGGVIVFDGYAPDETTRKRLSRIENADINFLKLGRGAPERYQAALDFGLSLLDHLSEGRFALRSNIITMTGIARSGTDYEALQSLIAAGAPQGFVLAMSEVKAPVAAPYLWSATKAADGSAVLSGMVPDAVTKASLAGAQGQPDTAALTYASGEPAGFLASAMTAVDLLQWLDSGSVSYDGTDWAVAGISPGAINSAAIEAEFVTRKLAAAGWSLDVTTTPAPVASPPVSPYTWSATRSAAGAVALSGHVPTEAIKKFLAVHAGTDVTDTSEIGAGAPEDFIKDTLAALDAVLALDSGKANFDGNHWILTGAAASAQARDLVLTPLGAAVDLNAWTVNITIPIPLVVTPPKTKPEPPVVVPEPPVVEPEKAEPPATEPPVAEPPVTERATPAVDPAYTFSATRAAGGVVTMSGQLPADPALRFFGVITGAPTTGVTIADGAPEDFILSAETGLRGLIQLESGQLQFVEGKWSLSGKAATNADRDAVLSSIAALSAGATWTTAITAPPPLDACQAKVAEFSTRNAILFQSGAAIIAADSEPALDELAGYLALCPEADVDIEGHTDADGDDQLNLALSVARAEAVVNALITRNVAASRLYAIGYGESAPIADNATNAGKRLNRRIVVNVLEHHVD